MKNKYIFVVTLLLGILIVSFGLTAWYVSITESKEESKKKIVTSFYPIYIACMNITEGAKDVSLVSLSEPQTGCLHDYQMTPQDMMELSSADIFVVNGGGVESFLPDVKAQYPNVEIVTATDGLELISEEDEVNAHAWMSVSCYRHMVDQIATNLAKLDPANADLYLKNAQSYDKELELLEQEQASIKEAVAGGEVVIFHEAYEYVAMDYDLDVSYCLDLDEERSVSAGELKEVIEALEGSESKLSKLILAEELYGRDMGDTVLRQVDAKVVYLDPLNKGEYNSDSYIKGMRANIDLLKDAFGCP